MLVRGGRKVGLVLIVYVFLPLPCEIGNSCTTKRVLQLENSYPYLVSMGLSEVPDDIWVGGYAEGYALEGPKTVAPTTSMTDEASVSPTIPMAYEEEALISPSR